jgi:FKBP-type peptidyl-prolyl cis-trans isomerase FkpA
MRTRTTINYLFFSFAVATILTSCKGGGSGDFKTDETTGVQYRFINHDENGAKPTDGSFAKVVMLWTGKNVKGDADTVFIDSHKKGMGDSNGVLMQAIPLKKSFTGCLEQGIMMMAKGDSAVFKINSDSLYLKTFHYPANRIPAFVKSNPTFNFTIKLVSFQTQQEMMAERQAEMQKRMEAASVRKTQEPADIAAYLQKNAPNVKPDADSIFYLKDTKGKGREVKEGDSLEVGYVGHFLDGSIFDQSDKGAGTRTFKFQYTKQVALIKGWISVLGKMHEGEKVTVLIPSNMAYGPQGRGQIQPYTPLIFDMELVGITSKK